MAERLAPQPLQRSRGCSQTEVGFLSHWRPTFQALLGQVGFLDRFTVTFSRQAQHLAVEEGATFDRRFGVPLAQ